MPNTKTDAAQDNRLIFGVVLAAYITTFVYAAVSGMQLSVVSVIVAVSLGAAYTYLCVRFETFLTAKASIWRQVNYFLVQLSLVYGISYALGPYAAWLIGLPLVAITAEYLGNPWQWPVYLGLLGSFAVAIYTWTADLGSALTSTLTYSPAIFFIVIYSNLQCKEREALQKAEALNRQLENANARLAAFAAQAEDLATMGERNRLAREIHDNLGHYLTVVNVQISAARVVMERDPPKALESLTTAQELTQKGLEAVRHSIAALRKSPLGGRPLPEAIQALVNESQSSGLVTLLEVSGTACKLSARTELTLYRAAQESLTNVRKHARASRVDLQLTYSQPQQVQLQVKDNGVGAAAMEYGFGLLGLQERANQLDGTREVNTGQGRGFMLTITLPCQALEE